MEERKLAPPTTKLEVPHVETKAEPAARQVDQRKLEAQRKQARTFAKQQQMAERIATATEQLSCGQHQRDRAGGGKDSRPDQPPGA
ncbi:MAG: hypothetical protein ACUVTA_06480 [Thermodesulfitimonas sp.]